MNLKKWLSACLCVMLRAVLAGCSSGSTGSATTTHGKTGTVFVYGRDAPLPTGTGCQTEKISIISLTGNEKYFMYWWHSGFSTFLFNSSLMVAGQHVSVGGPINNGTVTVNRVVLRHEGHSGSLVVGSTNVGANTFQFNSNGLAGVLFNGSVAVYCTPFTRFRGGLTSLNDLTGNTALPSRVAGLVLKDPISRQPALVARSVEQLLN